MTIKTRVVATIVWSVLMLGVGAFGIWYILEHRIPGVRAEERSARLGGGIGVLMSIGYAVLWLPLAAKIGRKRRLEREAQRKAQKKARKSKRSRE
jgi:type II secretory pathway component PulM